MSVFKHKWLAGKDRFHSSFFVKECIHKTLFNKTDSGLFLQWCARKKTDRKTHWCGCGRPLYQSDTNYVNDTLGDITNQTVVAAEMAAQVAAFSESMQQLQTKVTTMGGFFWQLMGPAPGNNVFSAMPFYSLSENRVSAKTGSVQHSLGNVGKKTRLHCREFGLGLAASGRPRQLWSQAERITVRGQPEPFSIHLYPKRSFYQDRLVTNTAYQ